MYSLRAKEMLKGAYDLHVHTYPSFFPRALSSLELARLLIEAGMAGAVVKAHHGDSTSHAYITTQAMENRVQIYGSVVLNSFVGGINPSAAESAVKLGAKIVFMPTISAKNHLDKMGTGGFTKMPSSRLPKAPAKPITVLDESGKLIPEVYDIFDIVKESNTLLATGHLSNEEGVLLCEEAKRCGVEKVVFTHPEYITNFLDLETEKRLVKQKVFMERTYIDFDVKTAVKNIKALGAENYILTTDFGQTYSAMPPDGMGMMVDELLSNGISESEIRTMLFENPKYILNV